MGLCQLVVRRCRRSGLLLPLVLLLGSYALYLRRHLDLRLADLLVVGGEATTVDAVFFIRLYKGDIATLGRKELLEWLEYMRYAGVGHFYMYDCYVDRATESLEHDSMMKQFYISGDVTYIDWSNKSHDMATVGTSCVCLLPRIGPPCDILSPRLLCWIFYWLHPHSVCLLQRADVHRGVNSQLIVMRVLFGQTKTLFAFSWTSTSTPSSQKIQHRAFYCVISTLCAQRLA
jgi:hypothetical protein